MNKSTEEVKENSQVLHELESPARRSFVKGIAGLGAALASSSVLSVAEPAQSQAHAPASPSHAMSPVPDAWGPFTPSSNAGRYLQLTYPPSTTAGELQIGVSPEQPPPTICIGRLWRRSGTACSWDPPIACSTMQST